MLQYSVCCTPAWLGLQGAGQDIDSVLLLELLGELLPALLLPDVSVVDWCCRAMDETQRRIVVIFLVVLQVPRSHHFFVLAAQVVCHSLFWRRVVCESVLALESVSAASGDSISCFESHQARRSQIGRAWFLLLM